MIHFYPDIQALAAHLQEITCAYTSIYILCDEHTADHCLPLVSGALGRPYIITIRSGEQYKSLGTCAVIWSQLTAHQADRHSLLIDLGGGVICDMGGFAAACYKRGIDFIHIPTTLLAMADASVGGKTGIDFDGYKNQVGVFCEAKEVLICADFLHTLGQREIRSGMAEVIKHYLIADADAFHSLLKNTSVVTPGIAMIEKAVNIKSQFVTADPYERNIRKALNYGHTIGHALESHYLGSETPLLHGEAVAMGMAIEAIISHQSGMLSGDHLSSVLTVLKKYFSLQALLPSDIAQVIALTAQDKKNAGGARLFVLLTGIGSYRIDVAVGEAAITAACIWYNNSMQ